MSEESETAEAEAVGGGYQDGAPPPRRPQQGALALGGETGPRYVATDVKDLIGLVARRHGILMRADDPAFVLVTIFEDISKRHMDIMAAELGRTLDALTASAEEQKEASRQIAGRIINDGGDYIAQKILNAGETMGPAIAKGVLAELQPTLAAIVTMTTAARRARQTATWAAAASVLAAVLAVGFVMTGGSI